MSVQPPQQFFIFDDDNFVNSTIVSTSSSARIIPAVGVAATANQGSLNLFTTGTPTTSRGYDFRIQNSGQIDQATYVWRDSTSSSEEDWKGQPDARYIHTTVDSSPNFQFGYGCTGVFSKNNNRELLYLSAYRPVSPVSNTIEIRYRDVSSIVDDTDDWTITSYSFRTQNGRGIDNVANQAMNLDVTELQDGTILMALVFNNDIDLYSSTDGLTFTLRAERISSRFGLGRGKFRNLKIASSGSYVRIVCAKWSSSANSYRLYDLVSDDAGASFTDVTDHDVNGIGSAISVGTVYAGTTGEDRFDLEITNFDENGSFIINIGSSHPSLNLSVTGLYYAIGINSLVKMSIHLPNGIAPTFRSFSVSSTDYVYFLLVNFTYAEDIGIPTRDSQNRSSTNNAATFLSKFYTAIDYHVYRISKNISSLSNISADHLESLGQFGMTGFLGGMRYAPAKGKLFVSGDGIAFFHALRDIKVPLANAIKTKTAYSRFLGWEKRPVYEINVDNAPQDAANLDRHINSHQPDGRLFYPQWNAHLGPPDGGVNSAEYSPWIADRLFTTFNWDPSRLRLTDNSGSGSCTFKYIDPVFSWAYGTIFNYNRNYQTTSMANVGLTLFGTAVNRNIHSKIEKSPDFNWAFVPTSTNSALQLGTAGITYETQTHGSCVRWEAKFENGPATTTASDFMVVGLSSFVLGRGSQNGTNQRVDCVVRFSETEAVVYDNIGGAVLGRIQPSSTDYGTSPFKDNYWEFRWGWYPSVGVTNTRCLLMCRQLSSSEAWLATPLLSPSTEDFSSGTSTFRKLYNQMVYFGHAQSSAGPGDYQTSHWRSFGVHPGDDLRTLAYAQVSYAPVSDISRQDATRGRIVTNRPQVFDSSNRISAVWGGSAGMFNDQFTVTLNNDYPAQNTNKFSSPRFQYRTETYDIFASGPALTETIVYEAPAGSIFYHDSAAAIRTNASKVILEYSMDNVIYGAGITIDMDRQPNGKIASVNQNVITVDWPNNYDFLNNEIGSTDKKAAYLRITTPNGGGYFARDTFKIQKSFGKNTYLIDSSVGTTTTFTGSLVGASVSLLKDRNYVAFDSPQTGKYIRMSLYDAGYTAERYCYLGNLVCGMSMTVDVPFSWQYSDTETPNHVVNRSRSGVQWTYTQGPPQRSLSLEMKGDVSEQMRRDFRDRVKTESKYGQNPMCLILEQTSNDPDMLFYGSYTSATALKNAGWYYDEIRSVWRPVGDLSVIVQELV